MGEAIHSMEEYMDSTRITHLDDSVARPGGQGLISSLFEINHNLINQSAMNVRAMANYISVVEQGVYGNLKFCQRRVRGLSVVFSSVPDGNIDQYIKMCSEQALENISQTTEEITAAWKTACECTNGLLSNIPEQMAVVCHSFDLLAAGLEVPSECLSSPIEDGARRPGSVE